MGTWTETREHAALDHLGTVRIWTDASGSQLPGFIYYPFGKQLTSYQDDEQIKFTGHERDLWNTTSTVDDLDYMHARHYNPQLGIFLQIDPLAGSVRAPQTLNRYAYVGGNPMNFTDPTGMNRHSETDCKLMRVSMWGDLKTMEICWTYTTGAPTADSGNDGPPAPQGFLGHLTGGRIPRGGADAEEEARSFYVSGSAMATSPCAERSLTGSRM